MKKRVGIAVLVIVAIAAPVYFIWIYPYNPYYNGKWVYSWLDQAIHDPDPAARREATQKLIEAFSRMERGEPRVQLLLKCWSASESLPKELIPFLIEAIHAHDFLPGGYPAMALAQVEDSEAVPALVAVIHDDDDDHARVSAICALEMMRAKAQAAVPDLRLALNDRNEEVRKQAARALKEIMDATLTGSQAGDERTIAGIKFCWCPPGKFTMGSPLAEPERRLDESQAEVTLSKGFWLGKYEVTQGQWKRVVGKLPGELTAEGGDGDDFPLGNVNYPEAEAFCVKLTELGRQKCGDLPADWVCRLPTEAQWEYACRAGTKTATTFGDKLGRKDANFGGKPYNGGEDGPSLNRATKVGSYPANAWGLHDMHGNVYEWCRDWYHQKLPGGDDPDLSTVTGQRNGDGGGSRVRRGGAWCDEGQPCRSARRLRFEPERRSDHIGFRVAVVQK
jgi:formylglycine-generating enzyme required for sulfatase activity